MRTLPEQANLRFLRREAKDVLAVLRRTAPRATLSDAQRTVAEQYGFHDWTALKAEVERRRDHATEADPETVRALAHAFGLGEVAPPMVRIADDFMGGTWRLDTASGSFSARPVFDWIDDAQAHVAVELMVAARDAGVRTPSPVRSPAGRVVERAGARAWRVDEWMDLGPGPSKPVAPEAAAAAGRILATLHSLALAPPERSVPAPSSRPSEREWAAVHARATASRVRWAGALERAVPTFVELASVAPVPAPSANILCHRDITPTTVRRLGREPVLMHWEFAGAEAPDQELGNTLAQWTLGASVNDLAARAFVDAYGSSTADIRVFSSSISRHLDWTMSRVVRTLRGDEFAARELPDLLKAPRSREMYERLAATLEPRAVAR